MMEMQIQRFRTDNDGDASAAELMDVKLCGLGDLVKQLADALTLVKKIGHRHVKAISL